MQGNAHGASFSMRSSHILKISGSPFYVQIILSKSLVAMTCQGVIATLKVI